MTSPGPYLAITQKCLSFTSLCLALKKFSGLTKNGGGGRVGDQRLSWKPLRHFATFSEIFGHLWIWLSPLQKISNLWIKKILTGELVSDSDLYNIPNAFYQFSILKILLGFPSRDSAAGQLGFTKTKEQSYKRNSPWYVGKWQSLYCPLLPLGVCNFVTFFVIKKCTVWLIYWSQTSLELPKVI